MRAVYIALFLSLTFASTAFADVLSLSITEYCIVQPDYGLVGPYDERNGVIPPRLDLKNHETLRLITAACVQAKTKELCDKVDLFDRHKMLLTSDGQADCVWQDYAPKLKEIGYTEKDLAVQNFHKDAENDAEKFVGRPSDRHLILAFVQDAIASCYANFKTTRQFGISSAELRESLLRVIEAQVILGTANNGRAPRQYKPGYVK